MMLSYDAIQAFLYEEARAQAEKRWADWLACDNSYAVGDRRAMEAGAGKYMNFISVVCRRK